MKKEEEIPYRELKTIMKKEELEKQIDFLMSAALHKCGNIQDAEELVQETLLAALCTLSRGEAIDNLRGWLTVVLNRRYYDQMRKKYRRPLIRIGSGCDIPDEAALLEKISAEEEAESLRREVAYLAKIHREAIVRHYMDGESVAAIAQALDIPEGTVKRRLHDGRSRIKKGMDNMKSYMAQSYQPVKLELGNSGGWGMNGEPASLVRDDLMAQNLLWLAYEKPVRMEELSRGIGIPAAYVEPVVEKLVRGELMRQVGSRYYTDFMISTIEDQERYIPAQKQFVKENFVLLWESVGKGIGKIKDTETYKRLNFDQRNSLELYLAFKCLEDGYYDVFEESFQERQVFPDRPNGGSWIALGQVRFSDYEPEGHREYLSCIWTGERRIRFEEYGDSRQIELRVYGTEGFPAPPYGCSFDGIMHPFSWESKDAVLLKLLYILHSGMKPGQLGFNPEFLRAIPGLARCRVLRMEENKPMVNIPVMDKAEFQEIQEQCRESAQVLAAACREKFRDFYKGKRQAIPAHLDSVPLQKQYLWAMHALMLSTIREAIKRGELYDGDYDDPSGRNPVPCPMLLMIDR